jgi:hypothetical protein
MVFSSLTILTGMIGNKRFLAEDSAAAALCSSSDKTMPENAALCELVSMRGPWM